MEKHIKNAEESAISDNLLQCDSPITFEDNDILASDSNKFKSLIKEILLIKRDKPVLNRTTKSFRLDFFWLSNVYVLWKIRPCFQYLPRKKKYFMNCKYNNRMDR